MRHPGQVFSREDLYEMIWGLESMGDNITVALARLRAVPADPEQSHSLDSAEAQASTTEQEHAEHG